MLKSQEGRARWPMLFVAVALVFAMVVFAACGDDDDGQDAAATEEVVENGEEVAANGDASCSSDGPIKIGAVSTLTGAIPLPEGAEGAGAYFDQVNADGGICGQQIEYISQDDQSDPEAAATVARRLVLEDEVVVMAGSQSFVDCTVNSAFYQQQNIKIVGVGTDPVCFSTPVASMVNSGPAGSVMGNLHYAGDPEQLDLDNVCAALIAIPGYGEVFDAAVASFEERTGKELAMYDNALDPTADPTPTILRAQRSNCDAVVLLGTPDTVGPWMQAVRAQDAGDILWMFPSTIYHPSVPKALGPIGASVTSNPELEPDTTVPEVAEAIAAMEAAGIEPFNIHLAGWLSAQIITDVIESIDGEVTRDSVSEALLQLDDYPAAEPFMGTSYSFGEGDAHLSNDSIKILTIENGEWQIETDWITVPGKEEVFGAS